MDIIRISFEKGKKKLLRQGRESFRMLASELESSAFVLKVESLMSHSLTCFSSFEIEARMPDRVGHQAICNNPLQFVCKENS